jgi:hypothetical protein
VHEINKVIILEIVHRRFAWARRWEVA